GRGHPHPRRRDPRARGGVLKAALAIVGLASCVTTADQYVCTPGDPSACVRDGVQGLCEQSHNCSFPDPTCGAPGSRYDASAQLGRASVCVLSAAGPSVTQPQPIGQGEPLLFEITTPVQTIVFDTEAPGTMAHAKMTWFASTCPPTGAME